MKFLWWYLIVLSYTAVIAHAYDLLITKADPEVSFFAIVFAIPYIIYVHKIHNYGRKS